MIHFFIHPTNCESLCVPGAILGVRDTEKNTDVELTLKREVRHKLINIMGSGSNKCYEKKEVLPLIFET